MDNTKIQMKLKLDKDFNSLIRASQKTGIPITLRGERIVDFKINNDSNIKSYKPDMMVIAPASISFDLTVGEDYFPNVPFNKIEISEDVILFKTAPYSYLRINFKMRFDKSRFNSSFTISPKSNKIKDILNYELIKKEYSGSKIQIKLSNNEEVPFEHNLPNIEIDEEYIKFLEKINNINDKFGLNLTLNEDYVITNKDKEAAEFICEVINEGKFKVKDNIEINFQISASDLEDMLNNLNQGIFKQNNYIVSLLGNKINLGECEISIKGAEILNEKEISNIRKTTSDSNEKININLSIKNHEKLYLKFHQPTKN